MDDFKVMPTLDKETFLKYWIGWSECGRGRNGVIAWLSGFFEVSEDKIRECITHWVDLTKYNIKEEPKDKFI